jgi:hypothetical protein
VKQELLILTEFTPVISGVLVVINISSTSLCTLTPTLSNQNTVFAGCSVFIGRFSSDKATNQYTRS